MITRRNVLKAITGMAVLHHHHVHPASVLAQDATALPSPASLAGVPMFRGNPARTGEMPGPGPTADPHILWDVRLGSCVTTNAVARAGIVYFGSCNGTIFAVDEKTVAVLWSFQANAYIDSLVDGIYAMSEG